MSKSNNTKSIRKNRGTYSKELSNDKSRSRSFSKCEKRNFNDSPIVEVPKFDKLPVLKPIDQVTANTQGPVCEAV